MRRLTNDLIDRWIPATICVIALAWSGGLHWRLGLLLYTEQALALIIGLVFVLVFFRTAPDGRPQRDPAIYDVLAGVIGFLVCGYIAWRYPVLVENLYLEPTQAFIVSSVIILLSIEAARRTSGWALLIVFGVFFAYALWGDMVPGILQGRVQPFGQVIPILGLDSTGFFGSPLTVVVTIVISFIFMGQLLVYWGGGDYFTDLATGAMGRFRGGSAKIAVAASALFGTISGSAVSNVASTGVITIPMMKRSGFRATSAGAVEAVASTGGQIMPPIMGAAAFLMADALQVSYGAVVIAATIPAFLYFFAVLVQVDLEAAREDIAAVPQEMIPPLSRTLRNGWMFPLPFAMLLGGMFWSNMPPETAALLAAAAIVVLSLTVGDKSRRLTPRRIFDALVETGRSSVQILIICVIAGMSIGVLNISGLNFSLGLILVQAGQGNLLLLLVLTGLVCIILGMSMPTTSLYILLAAIAAPAIIQLGATPMSAHMFVFYFGMMSMITPPVAFASFAAANISGADAMKTGWASMRLGWSAYFVPFLFVFSPSLLMEGSWTVVLFAFVTACGGIWLISGGIMGYFLSPLSWPLRIVFVAVGFALLTPADLFPGGLYLDVAGVVGAVVLVAGQLRSATKVGDVQAPVA